MLACSAYLSILLLWIKKKKGIAWICNLFVPSDWFVQRNIEWKPKNQSNIFNLNSLQIPKTVFLFTLVNIISWYPLHSSWQSPKLQSVSRLRFWSVGRRNESDSYASLLVPRVSIPSDWCGQLLRKQRQTILHHHFLQTCSVIRE